MLAPSVDPAQVETSFTADGMSVARAAAFDRAERHSRRVRLLKFVLPMAAIAMASAFVYYTYILEPPPEPVKKTDSSAFADGKLVMANPKLEGFTKEGRPYSMTAARAVQTLEQQGRIDLENIDANMPVDANNLAHVQAKNGVYDRTANTLGLSNDVMVTTTQGLVAKLQSAFIDIAAGSLTSDQPVRLEGQGSTITADSMTMSDNGKLVVFEKRVRVNIDPAKAKAAEQASGGTNASN